MTLIHPATVTALNAILAPIVLVITGFTTAVLIGAVAYRFWRWLKDRPEKYEPSEFNQGWGQKE